MRRMAAKKRRAKKKANGERVFAPLADASEPAPKRAAALARRIAAFAEWLADEVERWSRRGEPIEGQSARVLALLESALFTLSGERREDPAARLLLLDVIRDVIALVQAGSMVRGAVLQVAEAMKQTNPAFALKVLDAREAILPIVDDALFRRAPQAEIDQLVQDLAARMQLTAVSARVRPIASEPPAPFPIAPVSIATARKKRARERTT
jgi:hypothetical protein